MSGIFGASHLFFSGKSDFYEYLVNTSLRFDDASTSKLTRTLGSGGDRKKWTLSGWFKRGDLPNDFPIILASYVTTQNYGIVRFDSSGRINIVSKIADVNGINLSTKSFHLDVGAWYNIVVAVDTTQATDSDRVQVYINGEKVTAFFTATYPPQDYDTIFNYNILHLFGNSGFSPPRNYDGYMAQIHFVDGQQLTPTSFAEEKSGVWIPKQYTGSYGGNGFRLEFEDSSDIGKDTSGNNPANDFTPTALDTHDVVPDSPTNNFSTLNALSNSGMTLSEGSLRVTTGSVTVVISSTMAVNASGQKFYFEARANSVGNGTAIGIVKAKVGGTKNYTYAQTGSIYYTATSGAIFSNISGAVEVSGATYTDTDVIGVAVDGVNGTVQFFKNGVSQGTVTEATIGTEDYLAYFVNASTSGSSAVQFNFGQDSTFSDLESVASNADENGIGAFHHSVPSGFLAMCTQNITEPSISPVDDELPEDYFEPNTWQGNGTSQSRSDYEFSPDWVWIKERSSSSSHMVYDVIRGTDRFLQTNSDVQNTLSTVNLTSFDSNGFSLGSGGSTNQNNQLYVGWAWKAGGTPTATNSAGAGNVPTSGSVLINGVASTANLAGTIPVTKLSANTEAGFSIQSWTGDNSGNATIAHGLTKAPEMVIVKPLTETREWLIWHQGIGDNDKAFLFTDGAPADNRFGPNAPTSTVYGLYDGQGNRNGTDFIGYAFHSIEGYSKFGTYVGNGQADGTFVYTGFRPSFIMHKRNGTGNWFIFDNKRDGFNVENHRLLADDAGIEADAGAYDILSNGFKIGFTSANVNAGNGNYLYMAFAEMPFKYARSRSGAVEND
mgnify:CR=1 FL=1|jgi:hypothetical protein